MTLVYCLVAGVVTLVTIVGIALRNQRKRGEEGIEGELAKEALKRREKFEEHMAGPVPRGRDAIDRLP